MQFSLRQLIHTALLTSLLSVSAHAFAESMSDRELAAEKVGAEFLKRLGGELKKEMAANGPVSAISVCRDVAPRIANDLSIANGWKITRVSQKARNPLLGTPDAWENKMLDEFEIRAANGEKFEDMHTDQIIREGGKSYYRCMRPIQLQPICLTCHGNEDTIPAEVQAKLDEMYPHDKARGYKVGDVRGAISIKQSLDIALPAKP
ncbi:MAG: DUF3365 domain-containing protein [Gammaproteobacteria bacterium]